MRSVERTSAYGRALAAHSTDVETLLRSAHERGVDAVLVRTALVDLGPFVDPLVAELPEPEGGELVVALVATVLDLTVGARWRPGRPERRVVEEILVTLPAWCAHQPAATVRTLVAAAPAVQRGANLDLWAHLLGRAPEATTVEQVRDAVLVAAWRAGLARYRIAALDAAARLPGTLARAVLALEPDADVPAVLAAHRADRWSWPGLREEPGVVLRAGGSRVLGGPWFERPLAVAGGPTGWAVRADGAAWALVVDVHGHALVPLGNVPPALDERAPVGCSLPVPWQDDVTGLVPDGARAGTVLVSRAHSYAVDVVRLGDAGARALAERAVTV
ncbi:hypothetical protein CSO01_11930 [Cellulomonas soli]|uniref:Uncharacterized protein n=1 Tax=Cellulomonas soli TaxID=931535 RepID=A0A512PBB0_9CELL|nr:hypothetical protein CSO01_11930 [Cellulomonas soli]